MTATLPPAVNTSLQAHLGSEVSGVTRLSGGDISTVFRVEAGHGQFVVKVRREKNPHPALYFAEAQGLHLLGQTQVLAVPQVVAYGTVSAGAAGEWAYLIMNYLLPTPETPNLQEALGRGLAALHRIGAPQFGGTLDNFMGSLPQRNPPAPSAAEFFWGARLEPQIRLAGAHLAAEDLRKFEELREQLPALIPLESPALVHGDLWSGNILYSSLGPALIDPAATYSHREVDISMLRLFGGVNERVFAAYQEAYPLAGGWEARASLWNLYPLLAHLNMFGESYLGRLRAALDEALKLGNRDN